MKHLRKRTPKGSEGDLNDDMSDSEKSSRKRNCAQGISSMKDCTASDDEEIERDYILSDKDSDSEVEETNDGGPVYTIQIILTSMSLTPAEWRDKCCDMNSHELTRGSAWQQPDEEYFDTSDEPLTKFLIKWVHASYLHLSWETEKDLLDMAGVSAGNQLKKFRQRQALRIDLYEDLRLGEYVPAGYIIVERILDIQDSTVDPKKVDWKNAVCPAFSEAVSVADSTSVTVSEKVNSPVSMASPGLASFSWSENETPCKVASPRKVADDEELDFETLLDESEDSVKEEDVKITNGAGSAVDFEPVEGEMDFDMLLASDDEDDVCAQSSEQNQDLYLEVVDENVLVDESSILTIGSTHSFAITAASNRRQQRSCSKKSSYTSPSDDDEFVEPVEKKKKQSITKKKKPVRPSDNFLSLHGDDSDCWVIVKWAGLPYGEVSFEKLRDIRARNVEYEDALRAYYRREQMSPSPLISNADRSVGVDSATRSAMLSNIANSSQSGSSWNTLSNTEDSSFRSPNKGLQLRDYQWEGVQWLIFNWSQKRNSILADEMGLGKTIQTAAFLHLLRNTFNQRGPFLIVAPLSTIVNWQREILLWTNLDCIVYQGSSDDRKIIRDHEFPYSDAGKKSNKGPKGYKIEVVVTTPEAAVLMDKKGSNSRILSSIRWSMVVVDEAHKLKNSESKVTQVFRDEFSFKNCVLLTGTPLQNNTEELWTLLNFVDRTTFQDREQFLSDFGNIKVSKQLDKLHKKLKPYLLRREKENVEKTVPPKEEIIIEVELTVVQKQYYRAIYEQNTAFLYKGEAKNGPRLSNLAMELRKCCLHPFLIKGAKHELAKHFDEDSPQETLIKCSGKLTLLDKLLPKLKLDGHRVLIFSQFRIMLDLIEDYLASRVYAYDRIDGSVTGRQRQSAIDRFSAPNSPLFVMLLSTRAGGVGINLTAADTVIIFDSDWNPQNDIQAQARAHRIGQTKPVKVYRLLTRGTYEQIMFRAASLKLGLDYAVMHNMNGMKDSLTGLKATTNNHEKESHMSSSLSKKELEYLLKHGAYGIFGEEQDKSGDEVSEQFCAASIDEILANCAQFHHDENQETTQVKSSSSSFSKASFVTAADVNVDEKGNATEAVSIDDPDFWTKVVGLAASKEESEDGNSRRRKCRVEGEGLYKEPSMSIARLLKEDDNSDEEADGGKVKRRRLTDEEKQQLAEEKLLAKQQLAEEKLLAKQQLAEEKLLATTRLVKPEWTASNLNKLMAAMVARGYGHWDEIRTESKLRWSLFSISRGCRLLVLQLLYWSTVSSVFGSTKPDSRLCLPLSSTGSASTVVDVEVPSSSGTSLSDTTVYSNHMTDILKKFRLCRVALASWHEDFFHIPSTTSDTDDQVASQEDETDKIVEDQLIQKHYHSTADGFVAVGGKTNVEGLVTVGTDAGPGVVGLLTGTSLSDHSVAISSKWSTLADVMVAVEALGFPSEFVTVDAEKVSRFCAGARSKLMSLEDAFECYLVCTELPPLATVAVVTPAEVHAPEALLAEHKAVEPGMQIQNRLKFLSNEDTMEVAEGSIPADWWTSEHDHRLIIAINRIGWPEGKKRLEAVEKYVLQVDVPLAVSTAASSDANKSDALVADSVEGNATNANPSAVDTDSAQTATSNYVSMYTPDSKVLSKRGKDLAHLLRSLGVSALKPKKLTLQVMKVIARTGIPRSLFSDVAAELLANSPDDTCLAVRLSTYLLTWERLTAECCNTTNASGYTPSPQNIDKVKAVVTAVTTVCQEPTSDEKTVISSGPLMGLTHKACWECVEKMDIIHKVRLTLALLSETRIMEEVTTNCLGSGPSVPIFKRDTALPVWWTIAHDLLLLKLIVRHGCGQWRRNIFTSSNKDAKSSAGQDETVADLNVLFARSDFEMPVKEFGLDWVLHMNAKTCEKRVAHLMKVLHGVAVATLPLSFSEKTCYSPEPSVRKHTSSSASSRGGSGTILSFTAKPKFVMQSFFKTSGITAGTKAAAAPAVTESSTAASTTMVAETVERVCPTVAGVAVSQPVERKEQPLVASNIVDLSDACVVASDEICTKVVKDMTEEISQVSDKDTVISSVPAAAVTMVEEVVLVEEWVSAAKPSTNTPCEVEANEKMEVVEPIVCEEITAASVSVPVDIDAEKETAVEKVSVMKSIAPSVAYIPKKAGETAKKARTADKAHGQKSTPGKKPKLSPGSEADPPKDLTTPVVKKSTSKDLPQMECNSITKASKSSPKAVGTLFSFFNKK